MKTIRRSFIPCRSANPAEQPRQETVAPPSDNADLLARIASRDIVAFEQLYDDLAIPMFSLVVRIVRSHADAEDVLQNGFNQIWRCAVTYRRDLGSPFAWISTIMRRKAIDVVRARNCQSERLIDAFQRRNEGLESTEGDRFLIVCEERVAVREALIKLDREERSAILLAYFDGLTHVEIARSLGAPLGTVKGRIRRGMVKLRHVLDGLSEMESQPRSN
jgi:RNA polymerase sigma-70 factor (ECF subfamily)